MISEREYLEMELERVKREIAYWRRCDSSIEREKKLVGLEALEKVLRGRMKRGK